MRKKLGLYAVVRFEPETSDPELAVTVKEILPTQQEAEEEVNRLNKLQEGKNLFYFWQATRYFPNGRNISSAGPKPEAREP